MDPQQGLVMDGNCQIREAVRGDLPELLSLYFQLAPGDIPLKLPVAEAIWDRMASYPCFRVRVAEIDGILVGTYSLLAMDNLAHGGAGTAILENVVVREGLRGAGIGRKMMEEAMALARGLGCYKLALSSGLSRTGARSFYEELGCERHGHSFYVRLEEADA
jgi:GNAT superfamily N-acetyltransferase